MNHSGEHQCDERMTAAFRGLAARSLRTAPPELGVGLKDTFRIHHERRRRKRFLGSAIALAACITVFALMFWRGSSPDSSATENGGAVAEQRAATSPLSPIPSQSSVTSAAPLGNGQVLSQERPPSIRTATRSHRKKAAGDVAGGFIPLPTYDPGSSSEAFEIVRVKLRDRSLSQLGMPVREDAAGWQILADLLVDRDGIPLAVRFVGR